MMNNKQLIVDNMWIAECQAKIIYGKSKDFLNCELDDLIQEGRMGIMKAAESFKEELGACFQSYATMKANYRIRVFIRDKNDIIRTTRRHKPMSVYSYNILNEKAGTHRGVELLEVFKDENEYGFLKLEIENFTETILTKKEKEVFDLIYAKCLQQKEIGEKLGHSQAYISKINKRIRDKFSDEFEFMKAI